MGKVSDCCGEKIKYGQFYLLAALMGYGDEERLCSGCNEPCKAIEEEERDLNNQKQVP